MREEVKDCGSWRGVRVNSEKKNNVTLLFVSPQRSRKVMADMVGQNRHETMRRYTGDGTMLSQRGRGLTPV